MTRVGVVCRLAMAVFWSVAASGCATASVARGVGGTEAVGEGPTRAEERGATDTPPTVEELPHFVLVLRESSEGGVTHQWRRAETFSLAEALAGSSREGTEGQALPAVAHPRDCHGEFLECNNKCMSRPLPWGYGHMTRDRRKGEKARYCRDECWQPYLDCEELQGRKPQEFSAVDEAVDWLSLHRQTLLKGSLIFIAGVAFFAVSAGAGMVVLAPLVLLNLAEKTAGPSLLARMP
jgi:hypothetical protein